MKMLCYTSCSSNIEESIVADKIVRFSKPNEKEIAYIKFPGTYIHLTNGHKILAKESIKTLTARMENMDKQG